jgi:hypothetical protein
MTDALEPDFFTLDAAYRRLQDALLVYQQKRHLWDKAEFLFTRNTRLHPESVNENWLLGDDVRFSHREYLAAATALQAMRNEWAKFPVSVTYLFVHNVHKDMGYRSKLPLRRPLDGTI